MENEEQIKSTEPTKVKNKMPKPVLIVLAILVSLLVLSGVYYVANNFSAKKTGIPIPPPGPDKFLGSPTPETPTVDTSNWKSYSGNNFSFKYPPTYVVKPNSTGVELGVNGAD